MKFSILKSKKNRLYINFILFSSILFSLYFIEIFNNDPIIYKLIFTSFVIVVGLILINLVLIDNSYLLIGLFFIANLAFMYGAILFSPPNELRGTFFAAYNFTSNVYIFMIKSLYYNLAGIVFGLFLIDFFGDKKQKKNLIIATQKSIKDRKISQVLFWIMIIATAISLVFILDKISILYASGYLESRSYNNTYLSLYMLFFLPSFALGMSLNTQKRQKVLFLYLLLFYGLMVGLQGARGGFVISIFFYIWYRAYIFNERVKIKKLLFIGALLIFMIALLSNLRSGSESYLIGSFVEIVKNILIEQGTSVGLIGYYIDYPEIKTNPHAIPFIFGIFHNFYLFIFDNELYHLYSSSAVYGQFSSILGQRIPSIVNSYLYEAGAGLGGNYILEEYDLLGYFGVMVLTGLYIYILYLIQDFYKTSNKIFLKMIILVFIFLALFMPRTQYLTIGVTQFATIFIVFIIYAIFRTYVNRK